MGLTFVVGSPSDVFTEPYALNVIASLAHHFPSVHTSHLQGPWYSHELAWSGWAELQQLAATELGRDRVPHLLSMEAWKGVYLPCATETGALPDIPGDNTPLTVASLPALVAELQALGKALGLPIDPIGLEALAARYTEDDDLVDEDMEIQTYAQLSLAALVATGRGAPLWVVK